MGVIGLGYVGSPLGFCAPRQGCMRRGLISTPAKSKSSGGARVTSIIFLLRALPKKLERNRFQATGDFARLREMDAIIICVPTPLDKHREPDLSFVLNTAKMVSEHLQAGQLIVLESTTYPGTTDEDMLAILEKPALKCPVSPYITDGVP